MEDLCEQRWHVKSYFIRVFAVNLGVIILSTFNFWHLKISKLSCLKDIHSYEDGMFHAKHRTITKLEGGLYYTYHFGLFYSS